MLETPKLILNLNTKSDKWKPPKDLDLAGHCKINSAISPHLTFPSSHLTTYLNITSTSTILKSLLTTFHIYIYIYRLFRTLHWYKSLTPSICKCNQGSTFISLSFFCPIRTWVLFQKEKVEETNSSTKGKACYKKLILQFFFLKRRKEKGNDSPLKFKAASYFAEESILKR